MAACHATDRPIIAQVRLGFLCAARARVHRATKRARSRRARASHRARTPTANQGDGSRAREDAMPPVRSGNDESVLPRRTADTSTGARRRPPEVSEQPAAPGVEADEQAQANSRRTVSPGAARSQSRCCTTACRGAPPREQPFPQGGLVECRLVGTGHVKRHKLDQRSHHRRSVR